MLKRKFSRLLFAGFLSSSLLLASSSSWADSGIIGQDVHVGIGFLAPFKAYSVGYLQFFSCSDFEEIDGIKFSAGPHLGLGFAKELFLADLDAFIRATHRFHLPKNYALELYAKMPVGLTLAGVGGFAMGFNVGFIPGIEFFFKPRLAVFMEAGFFHHSLFPIGKALMFHEPTGTFNVGLSFKL